MSMATTTIPRPSPRCASELGEAKRPLHYLAVPPSLFATVSRAAGRSPAAPRTRAWWSRSRSAATARRRARSTALLARYFPEESIFRIDHYLGKEPVQNIALHPLRQRDVRADLEPQLRRAASRSPWPRISACRIAAASTTRPGRSAMWCRTTCCRCWRNLAMDPPTGEEHEAMRDQKARLLQAVRPLDAGARGARPVCAAIATCTGVRAGLDGRDLRRGASCTSTPGAGPACRSTSAPASACR